MENVNYRKEFYTHKYHAIFGAICLAVALLPGSLLGVIIGVTTYLVGLLNLPDSSFFKKAVDQENDSKIEEENLEKLEAFKQKRDRIYRSLDREYRNLYDHSATLCREIEGNVGESGEIIIKKLDELMWAYLRLLGIRQSLVKFLTCEDMSSIKKSITSTQKDVDSLQKEIDSLKEKGDEESFEYKSKLFSSMLEKLNTIKKRASRFVEAENNVNIVKCEEERLLEQIKLIRADAIATKNVSGLSLKIDTTIEHLDETNKWLSEFKDYQDLSDDFPVFNSSFSKQTKRETKNNALISLMNQIRN